jgi:hypothetical protein
MLQNVQLIGITYLAQD